MQVLNQRQIISNVTFRRVFDVPPHIVFKAWTDEKQVAAWWGPYGFTNPVCHWNARVNGSIYVDMTSADGMVFPMKGCFHEIEFSSRLVFTTKAFEDEDGNEQLEVLNTIFFIEEDWKTKFTLGIKIMKATPVVKESLDGMQQGWSQSLDKLEGYLSKKTLL